MILAINGFVVTEQFQIHVNVEPTYKLRLLVKAAVEKL